MSGSVSTTVEEQEPPPGHVDAIVVPAGRKGESRATFTAELRKHVALCGVFGEPPAELVQPVGRVLEYGENGITVRRLECDEPVAALIEARADAADGGDDLDCRP